MVNRGEFPLNSGGISEGKQSLGIDRKIRVPILPDDDDKPIESHTEYRYRLQVLAREIVGDRDQRLYHCLRRPAPGAAFVEVRRTPEQGSAHYCNLEVCSRVWTCPCCAGRISNERRKELSDALAAAKLKGYFPILVTYTLRHDWRDNLSDLLNGLKASLRKFKSGRAYQDIKSEYSVLGGIRALENTYGENGWHPHIHELMFLEKPISGMELSGLQKWLADRWIESLRSLDFDASYAHGIDVRTADSDIADYIAKWGREPKEQTWGVEHEIAAAPAKRAHRDGLTPFQLLECYGGGDERAGKLFDEYAHALAKSHQLEWSRGLHALLTLPEPLADDQLPLFEETETTYTAVEIGTHAWSQVVKFGLRGPLLWLVAMGDWTTLEALLKNYGISATIWREPPADAPKRESLPVAVVDHHPELAQRALFDLKSITPVRYE